MSIKANPTVQVQENTQEEQKQLQQQNEQQFQQDEQQDDQQKLHLKKQQKFLKPEFIYCSNNRSLDALIKTYPHLQSLKDAKTTEYEKVEEAYSYVIRSNNDDDIHKAIKYGVWCSTPPNNENLGRVYEEAKKNGKDVYLFYSVVKSGQFVGVAKLKSGHLEETFSYWWQHSKWRGHFKIEWLFVKDITYRSFENLKNENEMPVIRSKDGTKIDWKETGLPMMKIFKEHNDDRTIFQDFEHMDYREQFQRYLRSAQNQQNQYYNNMYNYNQYYPQYNQYQVQNKNYYNNAFPPQQQGGYYKQYYNTQGQNFYNNKKGNGNGYYKKNGGYNNKQNNYKNNYSNKNGPRLNQPQKNQQPQVQQQQQPQAQQPQQTKQQQPQN